MVDANYISELILVSYHESGHTIYALLHLTMVERVRVYEENGVICGITHLNYPVPGEVDDPELIYELMKSEICVNYAGLAAEKYYFKNVSGSDKFPMFWKNGSSSDTMAAAAKIKEYNLAPPGRKRYNLKKRLIKETAQELYDNWSDIVLIARSLFKKKRLSYAELKKY